MNPTHDNYAGNFQTLCRHKGLRVTQQRLEIYKELAESTEHPSAEMLHQQLVLRLPTLSLDTVYRTLATLVDHDLIHKVETVESQARFEVQHVQHHHLICRECNHIIDFNWELVDQAALPVEVKQWGEFNQANVVVYGTCQNCLTV